MDYADLLHSLRAKSDTYWFAKESADAIEALQARVAELETKKKRTNGELKRIWIQVDKDYLKFAEVLQQ